MDKHPSSACCILASCAARRRHSTPRPAPAERNPSGVRNLAGILLGMRIPKGTKTSNWAARELTAAQIAYAATDAWACRELFLRFQSLGLLRPDSGAARKEIPRAQRPPE